jgi:hypothetical protein
VVKRNHGKRWCANLILRGVGRSRISRLIINLEAVHRKGEAIFEHEARVLINLA